MHKGIIAGLATYWRRRLARKTPTLFAIDEMDYSELWLQQEPNLPTILILAMDVLGQLMRGYFSG